VRRVAAKACTIRCLPHWRSFVPVRVSVYEAAPGFSASDTSAAAAATAYQALLTANASAKARAQQQTTINQTDSAKLVEVASAYTPPAFADAVMSADTDGAAYSRVVTVQYEHGASRSAALRHLDSPHFQPGVQSECFYDPLWRPTAAFIPRTQLYFGHEMGWALWKWLLLLLLLAGTGAAGILINRPGAFGGEVVVDSATVVHSNITVIKDTTLH